MNEARTRTAMRRVLALSLCALLLIPLASAGESGVNKEMDLTGTAITIITTPDTSSDGVDFPITVTLDDEAASNGTTVSWTWQVCINTGVCLTPVPEDLSGSSDGKEWMAKMTPVDDHSYVNYKITLNYDDGNSSTYPTSGFGGKVWSDCWVDGKVTGGDGCPDEGGILPAIGIAGALLALSLAATIIRRD